MQCNIVRWTIKHYLPCVQFPHEHFLSVLSCVIFVPLVPAKGTSAGDNKSHYRLLWVNLLGTDFYSIAWDYLAFVSGRKKLLWYSVSWPPQQTHPMSQDLMKQAMKGSFISCFKTFPKSRRLKVQYILIIGFFLYLCHLKAPVCIWVVDLFFSFLCIKIPAGEYLPLLPHSLHGYCSVIPINPMFLFCFVVFPIVAAFGGALFCSDHRRLYLA